ncbi:2-hexaprenyl-6-methoxy-1,4-benzoquinone methyltransferase [Saxophila tyrrhenica]|uniref:2-methoxy-6-polyprenyl-1,4-benzoquinol methylase, mitochondrial n=1 Tax=Saxophila tyrrhenica TaxID=1690608 RepID=A0AAV9NU05_9PEZI|nr:2-hexaprenyl-6-methoxy-1,4-benzoquinone methyltransferase [Saxophila tyrrhenica]
MSSLSLRASKRFKATPPTFTPWVCHACRQRRTFAFTTPFNQQQPPPPQQQQQDDNPTHFGFETISSSLKASRVGAVFSSVASNYDTMNDLMSLGIHRLWKDHFVRSLNPGIRPTSGKEQEGQRILDIAGGTGDIAQRLLDHATTINGDTKTHVTISDINPAMLSEGRKRFAASPYTTADRVDFLEANAETLPTIESNSIDLYTVAFGIRNFTHKDVALREAFRVLKPGGVFACLEFTPHLNNSLLDAVYKRWSFGAIPLIGQVVAGDRESYQYLVESIERFPRQEEFRDMIKEAGFMVPGGGEGEGWEDLSAGIAAVHKGVKPV